MKQLANEAVLRLRDVGKEYRLYPSPRARLKALLTGRATHRSHWALRGVSFELRRGQCIGVIGDNGAGKSSLLKLLAGTLQPSTGTVERVGRVTAILELGAGFHPDFSGRDNLYFGGSLIGIDQEEMRRLEPEIVAFCELGEALDRPVKTYSSGMTVRLAFALVTAVQPDVLIIDEALAVGDQHFQKKCVERIMAFRENGCTILFCSHSPYHIRHLCDAALWLKGGEVEQFGPTEPVLAAYELHTRQRQADFEPQAAPAGAVPAPAPPARASQAEGARILSVEVANLEPQEGGQPALLQGQDLVVTITARGRGQERPHIGFMIEQSQGVGITSLGTHEEGVAPRCIAEGVWQVTLTFPQLPLHSGDYVISAYLFDATGLVVYDEWLHYLHLRFVAPKLMPGLVQLPHRWE
ncbi:ABC transporter ATP-binding protein [Pulveribacter suum]|uniref:ABC transporter ATP-binding protein n=1 Tax=Pulveribacter suum TaxID=2116657 RepID=A0A2P1NPB5_9BURK|nr:ABC transporter ATP-binding protein [Pulveribacter suum]AVP58847.1 ABC transporter ATP-binding protein [Pulveribacter suum]